MKASETSLRNLLEGGKQFQIPLFQRPYAWERKNWETLWEDILSLYNGEVEGSYFLGPIVTQAIPGTADGISPFVVIDGQQRLITLTILLATLRDHLIKQKNDSLADELYELYLINKFKQSNDSYKVLPTQDDRDTYKKIISKEDTSELEGKSKVSEAYVFFDNQIQKWYSERETNLELAKLKIVILENLRLVNITSEDEDNPYLIFESLNHKGQALTQADLVRNYIFMKLPAEKREKIYQNEWLPFQEKFKADMKEDEYVEELTKAFWFYLRKDGKGVSQKEVYKAIKKRCDNSEKGIEYEIKEIVRFTNYYQRLNFNHREPEPRLNTWFKRLLRLKFNTCHIFLLNVYHEYEAKLLSIQDFENILLYLESYFVRRLFAGVSTQVLGNVFNNLYQEVKDSKNLVNDLREVLMSYEGKKVWPNDDDFRKGIVNKSIYSSGSIDRVKLILERLENFQSKELVDPQPLNIEHIMPQKLTREWKTLLGTNCDSIQKQYLHTLGNLTLTGYNSELSNKSFAEKKSIYQKSNLSLNKSFKDVETWNVGTIQKRAEYLADIAIKVWPR
ncbi:hypothetical protein NIES593_01865 [Hydrococcus rivularis NIES-593]|uniref:DUF262 domain-containing protein n=1 Tax=Hydrococcus rivularis NIES-593 TaxID=1921803 RepID=A0A1U7HTG2_9CYAN|nr:DUF262 domain-containing protein [Hydrococcus rivularis]OKH26814.1 hypothetical protein NIES593_01865 [Hydrococcus rivularis NIES-593]